jgi:hypothetical protein
VAGMGISPGVEDSLLLGVLIGFFLIRRAVTQYYGTPVSAGRLIGYAVFYPVLFVLVVGLEDFPILPIGSVLLDVAAAAVGAAVALQFVGRMVTIYSENGRWMYRIGVVVPIVYVALFLARLGLETAIGLNPFAATPPAVTGTDALILEIVDALFGFSTGLAVGRNLEVYRKFRRTEAAAPARPPTPS